MNLRKYYFELKHDKGTFKISVVSFNYKSAVEKICNTELCPKVALTFIKSEEL